VTTLYDWARQWGVPDAALVDLRARMVGNTTGDPRKRGLHESAVQSRVRLEASQKGLVLWRNNVGVLPNDAGVPVRFGLANDSQAVNRSVKSGDLIGIRPLVVTPALVGATIGQFVSREIKPTGWRYKGTEREAAQLKWADLVLSLGGDAQFATGEGTL
jgi:hypothetical protein